MDKTKRILQLNEAINEAKPSQWHSGWEGTKFRRGETAIVTSARKKEEEEWVGRSVRIMAEEEVHVGHNEPSLWRYYVRWQHDEINLPQDQLAKPHEKMAKDTMNAMSKVFDRVFGKKRK